MKRRFVDLLIVYQLNFIQKPLDISEKKKAGITNDH